MDLSDLILVDILERKNGLDEQGLGEVEVKVKDQHYANAQHGLFDELFGFSQIIVAVGCLYKLGWFTGKGFCWFNKFQDSSVIFSFIFVEI